ncbi:hypothetical protein ACFWHV_08065, partial [Streptomyces collinus]|uniref:hypothetical protein n=1 Tax=Streptomyces collinus TaxID=42684 RepID=UPI00365DF919
RTGCGRSRSSDGRQASRPTHGTSGVPVDDPYGVDWPSVLSVTGIGAGIVLVVTLLSLPPLLKLMRPDGLRTE